MTRSDLADAYDAIAPDYDRAVAGDSWMRRRLWRHFLADFSPGQRILDLACGTGIDAVFLAQHGLRVAAVDVSPGMLEQLREKAGAAGVASLIDAQVLDADELAQLPAELFDGAISSFAGLNTVADLAGVADDLARVLRPGAHLIVHLLNRFSLWEWLGLLAHGRLSELSRLGRADHRVFQIGARSIVHQSLDPVTSTERFFAKNFQLRHRYAIGFLRPPHTIQKIPTIIVRALELIERPLGSHRPFLTWGRFFVLDLQRR